MGHSTVKTAKKFENIYPKEGEPWSSITDEELKLKGWIEAIDVEGEIPTFYFHKKCNEVRVMHDDKGWKLVMLTGETNGKRREEELCLRRITYMYQIDNMFHGFTDRWLGYI